MGLALGIGVPLIVALPLLIGLLAKAHVAPVPEVNLPVSSIHARHSESDVRRTEHAEREVPSVMRPHHKSEGLGLMDQGPRAFS